MNNENQIIFELIMTLYEYKYKLKNIQDEMNEKIKYYENKLMNLCKHEWDIDYSYLGEKTQYQCKYCKLYK